jgi:peptidoglycan/LPS O-acetylase OafA/YrhL
MNDAKVIDSDKKLDYVDIARAIAILMVIFIHTSQTVNRLPGKVISISQYGQMGVQLFFVASAYTMCLSHIKRKEERKPLASFFIRRYFRIAPLYYTAIPLYFLLEPYTHILSNIHLQYSQYNLQSIIANLLFIHGFVLSANNNVVPGGWSIGTEMAFYALFPILFPLFTWVYKRWGIVHLYGLVIFPIILNIIIQLIIRHWFSITIINHPFIYYNLINNLSTFTLGITLFFHHQNNVQFRFSIGIQIAFFTIATIILIRLFQIKQDWMLILMPIGSGTSFILLINILKELKYSNILLQRIGQISYSMYIFHFVFAWWLVPGLISSLEGKVDAILLLICSFLLTTIATFLISVFSHKYIEIPGIRLGKTIISRL